MRTVQNILAVLLLTACTGAVAAAPAYAQVRCGDTIAPGANVVLTADLTCDELDVALTVIGPAVLDLNGFTIACDDRNANGDEVITGISVEGSGAIVRGGTVRDCRQAIALRGAGRHQLSSVSALFSSSDGVRIESDRNRVTDSFAFFNGGSGFAIQGKANLVSGNAATGNRFGFDVEQRNTLERNVASGSDLTGFVLRSRSATLRGNRAVDGSTGFNVRGQSNRLEGNQAEGNQTGFFFEEFARRNVLVENVAEDSGISGFVVNGEANRLLKTRAEGNGANGIRIAAAARRTVVRSSFARNNGQGDLFDNVPDCGTNRWRNNDFGSANQACIE